MLARAIFSPARVRALTVHHLSRRLGREVSVGGARLSLRGALILSDIKIFEKVGSERDNARARPGSGREVFSCARAEAAQNIAALIRGSRQIAVLKISSPSLTIAADTAEAVSMPNFRRAFKAPRYRYDRGGTTSRQEEKNESSGAPPVIIGVTRIEISGGTIYVRRGGGQDFRIENIRMIFETAGGDGILSGGFDFADKTLRAKTAFSAVVDDKEKEITADELLIETKGAALKGSARIRNYDDAARLSYIIKFGAATQDLVKIFGGDGARMLSIIGKKASVEISGTLRRSSVSGSIEGAGIAVNF